MVKPAVVIQHLIVEPDVIEHPNIQPVLIKPDDKVVVVEQEVVPVVKQVINNVKVEAVVDAEKVPLVNEMKMKEKNSLISLAKK